MQYSEKLKDPRWQKKRLDVLNRDEFTCQYCGDKETELHVHHQIYHGEPWEADPNVLITLCKHCHILEEFIKTQKIEYVVGWVIKTKWPGRNIFIYVLFTEFFHNSKGELITQEKVWFCRIEADKLVFDHGIQFDLLEDYVQVFKSHTYEFLENARQNSSGGHSDQ